MKRFTREEKERISAAIHAAESGTSGQFVAVVAHASEHYLFAPLLWSAILALLLPGGIAALSGVSSFQDLYQLQLGVFVILGALFLLVPGLHLRLIPRAIKHHRASRLAHAQFYDQGIHRTRDHSGVLFFVSMAERYVEIVADQGIHEQIGETRWQQIIELFLSHVRNNEIVEGFVQAIHACGEAMKEHYPSDPQAANELSDGLVEI
ncbi:MAG: TPM domain-containing protein [Pseudomonadota bacterium]|nr:TPM domain-containing protein [Pseudomonadota bacterium]